MNFISYSLPLALANGWFSNTRDGFSANYTPYFLKAISLLLRVFGFLFAQFSFHCIIE